MGRSCVGWMGRSRIGWVGRSCIGWVRRSGRQVIAVGLDRTEIIQSYMYMNLACNNHDRHANERNKIFPLPHQRCVSSHTKYRVINRLNALILI